MPLRLHPAQGNPIEIDAQRTLIGRDKTAEIRLTESSVSRKHATIERRGPQWVITDGGSANGTFLDDVQVAEGVLKDGQSLRLGAVSFKVEVEEEPTPTQTLRPSDLEAKTQPAVPAYRPPPAAAPAVPSMTPAQAAELLGVAAGTAPADVRRQYQKLHNDLQVRMTNTPSPSLKRMYQKNLQELKLACEVLAPGSSS
ncbi:MAG TPA: FHA domain-containing protein [Vicinamibacteria bacterium]|nr:FHA domain-containing protein [Vicinamibacteria bacterium]